MEIPDIPFDAISYTLVAVTFALPMAFPVSLALLWVYLRAVKRSMLRRVAGEPLPQPPPFAPAASGQTTAPPERLVGIATVDAGAIPDKWTATNRVWLAGVVHAIAGLIFAYVMGTVYLLATNQGFDWQVALGGAMLFTWPVVITLSLVCTVSWLGVGLVVLGYVLVLAATLAVFTVGTTISAGEAAWLWFGLNRDATLLALASLARPIRAVGPLVSVFMISVVAGAIFILPVAYNSDVALALLSEIDRRFLGVYGAIAVVLLTGAILTGMASWLALRWLGRLYRAHRLSDQSIMIDAVLLIFAFEYGIGFAQKGVFWLLGPVGAFLAYKVVAAAGLRLVYRWDPPDVPPKQLLLLRVFSLGRRSGRLFRGFSKLWRYLGSLYMIAGPDLATSTVEPHEFLDFTAGHLQRRFISGPDALKQRLAESLPRCDPDGRYRSSSFFCYDDTWKMVLGHLAEHSDAVLMDLRGFTKEARGCIYEINELLDVVPLERIVFIIDRTTDEIGLAHVFSDGWARLGMASPNRADLTPQLRLVRFDGLYGSNIANLVALLATIRRRTACGQQRALSA